MDLRAVTVFTLASLLAPSAWAAAHDPAWSPEGARLVYYANTDGDFDIYIQAIAGGAPIKVQDHPAYDGSPRWRPRPDGRATISFASDRSGRFQLYEIRPDGSEERALPELPGSVTNHDWSSDGRLLVFEARVEGNNDIYLLDTERERERITRITDHDANDFDPSFSPDDGLIVFQSNRSGRYQLHMRRLDGPPDLKLTESLGHAVGPDWSAADRQIVYSEVDGRGSRLMRFTVAGREHEELARFDRPALKPDVTPDGDRIAFFLMNTQTSGAEIYVLRISEQRAACWTCE